MLVLCTKNLLSYLSNLGLFVSVYEIDIDKSYAFIKTDKTDNEKGTKEI